jgi:hypothetical protein
MKVIYSFKELRTDHYKPIDDNFFKLAKLSVELAKKYYTTEFYGDDSSYRLFNEKGIEFDKVVLLDSIKNYNGDITSYSKLMAMMNQTEPYMCLDFDSLLFQQIPNDSTFIFGYPEISSLKLHNILTEDYPEKFLDYVNLYYKRHLVKYKHKFPSYLNPSTNEIPNFSLFVCNHPTLIREILNDIFNRFEENELEEMGAMFIEQLLIYLYLIELEVDVKFLYDSNFINDIEIIQILKHKFYHYIRYHEDNEFDQKIKLIANSYNISTKLKEKLL